MKIKVELVVEALEMASDFATGYYDTVEGTVRWLHECSDFDDGLSEAIENEPERFLILPNQYDIHEYEIMMDFVDTLPDGGLKEDLYALLRGSGAFRRFKNCVNYHRIEKQWYEFKQKALVKIAEEWCDKVTLSNKI